MRASFIDISLHPAAFFSSAPTVKERLKIPWPIMIAARETGAVYGNITEIPLSHALGVLAPEWTLMFMFFGVIGGFCNIFILWVIWAGVMYLISGVFKGQGSFARVLEFTAYGYIPQIIGTIVSVIVALEYIPHVTVPKITSAAIQDPQAMQEVTKALMHDSVILEMMQIVSVVSIVFLLWSAHIWIFGMRQARQISFRDAALSVSIPVITYIAFQIYPLAVM